MKIKHLLFLLALTAGVFVGCTPPTEDSASQDKLTVSPASQKIGLDGTASFTFSFTLTSGGKAVDLKDREVKATVSFEATGGSVSPASAVTDENGQVTVTFTAADPESFKGGTVKGTVKKVESKDVFQQGNLATATADVLPRGADDQPIEAAKALKENTYSVQKKGGAAQVFTLPEEYSEWYVGSSYMDGTQQAILLELMDEDAQQMTMGWLSGEIPPEVANKLTTISQEFYSKYPWAAVKMGTMRLGQDKMLDCHMGQGGNVKLDGSSQFWLKEKTRAYSGQYQFLFVFVFENQSEEYTICGNAVVKELKADLENYSLNCESNWVAPGQSVTLTARWTPGARFDWSKVKLDSQTCNGQSGEWFSWNASTQKLTATQSAGNQQVKLVFSYTGLEKGYTFSLYNGPGYSSFKLSPKNGSADFILVENDPYGGWSYDDVYIQAAEWKPDSYSFNGYGIEIDPSTENYNKLDFNPYGMYVDFKKGIPVGDFNLIFRSVTDHSAKCTIPVKVVEHKAYSFKITYPHSNGAYEPWTSGGENGVCNYPMGLSLGVITVPEDAYWDWSHVELVPGYDTYFSFSGHGGRDDHPKLQLKASTGSTQHGTQVIFRLKWDNRKKSEIYVDHN
ncbi:MAG: Ig-like domain-containing protein [Bacteroidales bacterium]|nr:Ig-like domain-containing protein [Bacteroidales bacterium]